MRQHTLKIVDGEISHPLMRLNKTLNFHFDFDEHIAIIGPNGAGKSILVDVLLGKYPLKKGTIKYDFTPSASTAIYENIQYLEFRDGYGMADSSYYYQQRWNSWDCDAYPTVEGFLGDQINHLHNQAVINLFQLKALFSKKMLFLSSGELRKVQLAKALLKNPRILILDNLLIGLDVKTRVVLLELLNRLSETSDLQIIMVLPTGEEIPSFITHVLPVKNKIVGDKLLVDDYRLSDEAITLDAINRIPSKIKSLAKNVQEEASLRDNTRDTRDEIVRLNKVSLAYNGIQILKEIDWVVHRGDKWKLTGENGSGKSALLSLIYADNPQSYAKDIFLFGRKRGTGESIWDIKSRMGYLSPEMHRSYLKNSPVIEIVASGLHDSLGLYKKTTIEQQESCLFWLDVLQISHLKEQSFLRLSSGEQRLALLARAFVKNPELLILDEPFHGLDRRYTQMVRQLIESFCDLPNKTLIMVSHYDSDFPKSMTHSMYLSKLNYTQKEL